MFVADRLNPVFRDGNEVFLEDNGLVWGYTNGNSMKAEGMVMMMLIG
jgi:hypothetical protein